MKHGRGKRRPAPPLPAAPAATRRHARPALIHFAFAASVALHGLVLALNFTPPASDRQLRDRALDIVLVNSKSAQRPQDAQVLAQANLDGGGTVDENRRAKSPLPPSPSAHAGDQVEAAQQRVRALEARQRELLTQAKKPAPVVGRDKPTEVQPEAPPTLSGADLATSAMAMIRLQAEIDRNVEAYNKRPKKTQANLRAREVPYAMYTEEWRQKVERVGTLNYPEAARGKLYGSLVLSVSIRTDGSIENIEVERSSGHKLLDAAARRIVQMAGPYAPLPPEIRRDTDILVITRTWFFTREDTVKSL